MSERFSRATHNGKPPKRTDPDAPRKPELLTDPRIEALREMADDTPQMRGYWKDSKVFGLAIFLSTHSNVWRFRHQKRVNGKVISSFKTLGTWPAMTVDEARKEGLIYAGSLAAGTAAKGKRTAMPFRVAFENYLEHLKTQAEEKGKPPRWYLNAKKLAEAHIFPQWDGWTLVEMSQNPRAVKTWHAKLAKTIPTTAAHCVRLIRACYRQEAGLDRTLNPMASPTSGIKLKKRRASQKVLDFEVFPKWRIAWEKIENPVHRGYHLTGLLTGIRPGELANLRLDDVDLEKRMLVVRNPKAELNINLPITPQIAQAIAISVNAPPQTITQTGLRGMKPGEVRVVERKKPHGEVVADDFVFPGARQAGQRSGLPISGNALRHTFRTIAVDCEISEMLIHFLCGHALDGVSEEYTNKLMIEKGPAMRAAQEKISARMFQLLGLKLGPVGPAASGSHHDAPLVPSLPTRKKNKAAA
ncbi:integrase family protein [Bradyrhizobium sp. 27S5]|uniref:integrase family protein n=1 Tax=Bradyrhizobium sp. 27S5 TaxID=3139728 RepID=UPI0030D4049E